MRLTDLNSFCSQTQTTPARIASSISHEILEVIRAGFVWVWERDWIWIQFHCQTSYYFMWSPADFWLYRL